ncbi:MULTISPECIES: YihY/virulence factor BrkB family protein [Streptomyces violaceusniger group]|uniref:YhjD/YihY/BrkB family envelope integrity protein n=2 Tax=Streptomyces violaceusniger group TaxID=2839105 RepID=A0ABD5JJC7_9ACTN|nr:YihY/virulence factor BrkB family protein [Streptomyces violaceusniger]MEE4587733.1 YhjD/YihY/BrkB family envelope integrity protein [Streptomyces sp. DSM 41602]
MESLTRLPVVGPAMAWLMRTHAWRTYERLDRVHWTRLAAAITFTSFIAFFPLIAVGAAVGAAMLSQSQMAQLQKKIAQQIPGISGQLDLGGLVQNAATIGVVAGALLLFTGISWVGSLRECLRAVWELEEDPGNPLVRKVKDGFVLIGLGGVALVSFAVSALAATAVGRIAQLIGIPENGVGGWLLRIAAFAIAVCADLVLLSYVLTWLPGVQPPRRTVVVAALIGAIGFELLKVLLSSYLKDVAAKSMYGAFGVPIALLLWMNFTAKLTLYCAAWTATPPAARAEHEAEWAAEADQAEPSGPDKAEPSEPDKAEPSEPDKADPSEPDSARPSEPEVGKHRARGPGGPQAAA